MFFLGPKFDFRKKIIILQKGILLISFSYFTGCSGYEKSERERLREQNAKGEYIYRYQDEVQYPLAAPAPQQREPYPWETHLNAK